MSKKIFGKMTAILSFLLFAAPSLASEGKAGGKIPDNVAGWDHLWNEMMTDIIIIGVVFAAIILYFMFRYRRSRPEQEGEGSKIRLSAAAAIGWAIIPAFLFMADDFYLAAKGWALYNDFRTVPENAYEIKLESSMWNWSFAYPEGVSTMNELRVPVGTPVLVRMISKDVVHSMFLPDFRVKEDSMPGRVTYLWFYPKTAGEHVITCAEFCGFNHNAMKGKLIAMPKEEFTKWIEEEKQKANIKGGA